MVTLLDYSLAPTGKTLLEVPQIVEALKQGMLVGTADTPTFPRAPIFLKDTLTFPYRYGIDFTAALLNAGGKDLAFAGAFKESAAHDARDHGAADLSRARKTRTAEAARLRRRISRAMSVFDIGAMGEFDVAVLVEQYAGGDEARELYPHWRGGYYFAGRPKGDKSAPLGVVVCVALVESGEGGGVCGRVREVAGAAVSASARTRDQMGRFRDDAPPADSWRTSARTTRLADGGRAGRDRRSRRSILISESLDDETTKRVAEDFWGSEK